MFIWKFNRKDATIAITHHALPAVQPVQVMFMMLELLFWLTMISVSDAKRALLLVLTLQDLLIPKVMPTNVHSAFIV